MTEPTSPWTILGACAATLTVALALVGGIGILTLGPIRESLVDRKEDVARINRDMAPLLTLAAQVKEYDRRFQELEKALSLKLDRDLFDQKVISTDKVIEDDKTSTLRAAEELTHQVHDLELNIVNRAEHDREAAQLAAEIAAIQARINAITLSLEEKEHATPK